MENGESHAMAMTLREVVRATEIAEAEIVSWVAQAWVLPGEVAGRWVFDEADRTRILLIRDLREDMGINDEAVPLVLRLLDQVYSLREALGEIQEAVQELPESHRSAFEQRLHKVMEDHAPKD